MIDFYHNLEAIAVCLQPFFGLLGYLESGHILWPAAPILLSAGQFCLGVGVLQRCLRPRSRREPANIDPYQCAPKTLHGQCRYGRWRFATDRAVQQQTGFDATGPTVGKLPGMTP